MRSSTIQFAFVIPVCLLLCYGLRAQQPAQDQELKLSGNAPVKSESKPKPPDSAKPLSVVFSAEEKKAALKLLPQILAKANQQAAQYNRTFRDLSAVETRTSELFNREGKSKEQRVIVCDLFVYQSRLSDEMAYEYRVARTVDGKPFKQSDERAGKIFSKLLKVDSLKKEQEIINDEVLSYDLKLPLRFYGVSLYQWREILEPAQPCVSYEIEGLDKLDDHETLVLSFRQHTDHKLLQWVLPWEFGFKKPLQRTRGRLWLDGKTGQIRRAEREMWLQFQGISDPVLLWRQRLTFSNSDFDILVPKQFFFEFYFFMTRQKDGGIESSLQSRLLTEFSEFKRFDITSEESDKKVLRKDKSADPPPEKEKP